VRAALPPVVALVMLAFAAASVQPLQARRAEFDLAASLDWRQEVPRPAHPVRTARGSLTGDLDHQERKVHWKLVYRKLSGRPTEAAIRRGKRGRRGLVLVRLCGKGAPRRCKSGLTGTAVVPRAVVLVLEAGNTYVELRTRLNRSGEIRGQIAIKR
jgi:hypothetical protein